MTNELATTNDNTLDNVNESAPAGAICTIDMNDNQGKMTILNAMNNAESLAQHMDEVLHICDCITQSGTRRGRNGMPDTSCINTYLIDVDGTAYFSQSDGVARSVYMIASLWSDFGKATDDGYLALKCIEKPLANGNTVKNIVAV